MRTPKTLPLIAALMGMAGMPTSMAFPTTRERKPYPTMVTSSPEEIAEHNANVTTRQVVRRQTKPWNHRNWVARQA